MGRLDRIKQAQEASKANSFNPMDLNEGNVQAIFNRCIATDNTTEYIKAYLKFNAVVKQDTDRQIETLVKEMSAKGQTTESTKEQIKAELYQQTRKMGFNLENEQCSEIMLFDKPKLLDNLKYIRYLYGQLRTTHEHSNTISINENNTDRAMLNYTNKVWTENKGILRRLFYLGIASDTIYPFSERGNSSFQNVGIQPTLSPKDPNFTAWWEQHKTEWE